MKVEPLNLRREDISDLSKGQDIDRLLRGLNAFGAASGQAFKSSLTFADNLMAFVKEIEFTTETDVLSMTVTPVMTGTFSYRKDRLGYVHLSGTVTLNAAVTGAGLCTFGAAYQPEVAQSLNVCSAGALVNAYMTIAASGVSTLNWAGAPATLMLDGVVYVALDRRPVPNTCFPQSFTNELAGRAKPTACWVWQAWDLSDKRMVPICAGPVAWELSSKGDQIVVRDVANLAPNRKYRIRLVVVAG
jgi:hypothetical protein